MRRECVRTSPGVHMTSCTANLHPVENPCRRPSTRACGHALQAVHPDDVSFEVQEAGL